MASGVPIGQILVAINQKLAKGEKLSVTEQAVLDLSKQDTNLQQLDRQAKIAIVARDKEVVKHVSKLTTAVVNQAAQNLKLPTAINVDELDKMVQTALLDVVKRQKLLSSKKVEEFADKISNTSVGQPKSKKKEANEGDNGSAPGETPLQRRLRELVEDSKKDEERKEIRELIKQSQELLKATKNKDIEKLLTDYTKKGGQLSEEEVRLLKELNGMTFIEMNESRNRGKRIEKSEKESASFLKRLFDIRHKESKLKAVGRSDHGSAEFESAFEGFHHKQHGAPDYITRFKESALLNAPSMVAVRMASEHIEKFRDSIVGSAFKVVNGTIGMILKNPIFAAALGLGLTTFLTTMGKQHSGNTDMVDRIASTLSTKFFGVSIEQGVGAMVGRKIGRSIGAMAPGAWKLLAVPAGYLIGAVLGAVAGSLLDQLGADKKARFMQGVEDSVRGLVAKLTGDVFGDFSPGGYFDQRIKQLQDSNRSDAKEEIEKIRKEMKSVRSGFFGIIRSWLATIMNLVTLGMSSKVDDLMNEILPKGGPKLHLPKFSLPSIPSLLHLPKFSLPSIPSMLHLPKFSLPAMPSLQVPKLSLPSLGSKGSWVDILEGTGKKLETIVKPESTLGALLGRVKPGSILGSLLGVEPSILSKWRHPTDSFDERWNALKFEGTTRLEGVRTQVKAASQEPSTKQLMVALLASRGGGSNSSTRVNTNTHVVNAPSRTSITMPLSPIDRFNRALGNLGTGF